MRFSTGTRFATLVALIAALAVPTAAHASAKDVIRDCVRDGDLDKNYSDKELREAERLLPSDIDEYSNCREVIRQAQAGGRGGGDGTGGALGGGSGGGGYGSGLSGDDASGYGSAGDQREFERRADAARNGDAPEDAGAARTQLANAAGDSGLPTPALVAIILLVLAGLAGAGYLLRDRLPPGLTSRIPGLGPGQGR